MHFSDTYRLRWYRRAFTRKGASSKCRVEKCVELIRQVALQLLNSSLASFFVFR